MIEVVLQPGLTTDEAADDICARIKINASEAGEFVQRIQIHPGRMLQSGFVKWTARYQLGPASAFPEARMVE